MVQLDHATNVQMYWTGYNHGLQGMSRRNLYSGEQSDVYDLGFNEGLDMYSSNRRQVALPTDTAGPRIVTKVLAMRNEIEKHRDDIRRLEEKIRKLEAS